MTAAIDPLSLDAQLCFAIYSAGHAFSAAYREVLEPLGLTYPQYLAMLVLGESEAVSVKAVAARLRLDPGTVTPILKRLEKAGLATRRRDPEDERVLQVSLTKAGHAMHHRLRDARHRLVCSIGLSEAEVAALRATVAGLSEQLWTATEATATE